MSSAEVPKIPPSETLMMPARDGAGLYTELFFPPVGDGPWPVILIRTPYPDPVNPWSRFHIELWRGNGYAVAIQACRGTYRSEGRWRMFQNEAEDGYDAVEWVATQPWANGRVGMWGVSYLASTQWLAAKLRPPHLCCIAPQSPGAMFFYETPYLGGVFLKNHMLSWPFIVGAQSEAEIDFKFMDADLDPDSPMYRAMHQRPNRQALVDRLPAHVLPAILEALEHPTLDDWWRQIILQDEDAAGIDIPILASTGFHDGDQYGCLYNWDLVERNAPQATERRSLIIGPWRHTQMIDGQSAPMGEVRFGKDASQPLPEIILEFFDRHLKDRPEGKALSEVASTATTDARVRLYTSGSNRWHDFSHYPPPEVRDVQLSLASGGRANSLFGDGQLLLPDALLPAQDSAETSAPNPALHSPDQMVADPALPVPCVAVGCDGRENSTRHDVLVYTSPVLEQDLTVIGPVRALIHMAVNAPDADVCLRIEDVHPDSRALNMTGDTGVGPFRARYREGFERELLIPEGEIVALRFHICHMGHTFLRGHRIRLVISGTAGGLLDPNDHTGEPVLTAVERRSAVQTIYHEPQWPSGIVLAVLRTNSAD